MATVKNCDAELAAMLGFKPNDSVWKTHLFVIARFREDSEQAALKEQPRQAAGFMPEDAWARFFTDELARGAIMQDAAKRADSMLHEYYKRFPKKE